ncbi:hypothetical protein HPB47_017550 [Ixodes persulcatus]|uniref:Uncharacterized protein n=1 Tax=Ixodes persulcatus TaxID=34615 RepID=A0AC60R1B6_IXOPE|nr:hypothetical protein HPB47_017550 [Ixodes persulcatus]
MSQLLLLCSLRMGAGVQANKILEEAVVAQRASVGRPPHVGVPWRNLFWTNVRPIFLASGMLRLWRHTSGRRHDRRPTSWGLRSVLTPIKPSIKTFEELLGILNEYFLLTPSKIIKQYTFDSRCRQKDETISEFLAALLKLAELCNFGNTLDIMIRDRLVCGVRDVGVQKRLLAVIDDLGKSNVDGTGC